MTPKRKTGFSKGAVDRAITKLQEEIGSIDGRRKNTDFQRLSVLRDELHNFSDDLSQLIGAEQSGPPLRLLLAADDTVVNAFAAPGEGVGRFAFPLSPTASDEAKWELAAQSLFRMDRVIMRGEVPVLFLPPSVDGCLLHEKHYFTRTLQAIQSMSPAALAGLLDKVEQRRSEYNGLIERVSENLKSEIDFRVAAGRPTAGDKDQHEIDKNTRGELRAAIGVGIIPAIAAGTTVIDRLRKAMSTDSRLCFLNEFVTGKFGLDQIASDEQCEAVQEAVEQLRRPGGIEAYGSILSGLADVLGNLNRLVNGEVQDEWRWRSAASATYVHAINDILGREGVAAQVQFVTMRSLLATAVRAFADDELLVPVRHPKFLAAQIPPGMYSDLDSQVQHIVGILGGMIGKTLKMGEVQDAQVKSTILQLQAPWAALKRSVYSTEAGYSREEYGAELNKMAHGALTGERMVSFLEPLAEKGSAPRKLLAADLELKTKSLLSVFLRRIARQSTINAYFVEGRPDDPAHWMLLPNTGALRYVMKLHDIRWTGALTGTDYQNCVTIDLNGLLDVYADLQDFQRKLCLPLACAVLGKWELVERYLQPSDLDAITEPDFRREGMYLRQFALRALAAERTRKKSAARTYLLEACQLTRQLEEEAPSDMRYQLARIGTVLEVISIGGDLVHDTALQGDVDSPVSMALRCQDIVERIAKKSIDAVPACPGQHLYWSYMRSRAQQMQFMVYITTWAGWTPNPAIDQIHLRTGGGGAIDWKKSFDLFDRSWREWPELECCINGKTTRRTTVACDKDQCPVPEEYAGAAFVWNFAKLYFEFDLGKQKGEEQEGSCANQLKSAGEFAHKVMECVAGMEESCNRLSRSGFARRLFGTAKKITYTQVQENLVSNIDAVFFDMIDRLERSQ